MAGSKATRTCDFSNQEFIEHTKRGAEFLRPLNFQWLVVIILEGDSQPELSLARGVNLTTNHAELRGTAQA